MSDESNRPSDKNRDDASTSNQIKSDAAVRTIKNDYLKQAEYLWKEYQYRHDLIWRLIFQFTTAVVIISVLPYIQTRISACLGEIIVIVPILATILAFFGVLVMMNELDLFSKIKQEYRTIQNKLFENKLHKEPKEEVNLIETLFWEIVKLNDLLFRNRKPRKDYSSFKQFVLIYLVVLTTLSLLNTIFVLIRWVPLLPACTESILLIMK